MFCGEPCGLCVDNFVEAPREWSRLHPCLRACVYACAHIEVRRHAPRNVRAGGAWGVPRLARGRVPGAATERGRTVRRVRN